ncbi:helix-turn-helix domain-containing protein [Actinomadura viridis]|uniref:helix-turn-helix domain-containing protein n=1 Tax=Actinomadura viridis TaxID=58110 RepID=UPI0036B9E789
MSTGRTGGPDSAGPTVARMLLGGRLRRLREARGITREAAGEAIRASHSKISRLELGRTGFKTRDVEDLLTLYGVTGEDERKGLLDLVRQARETGWVHEYNDVIPGWQETRLELEQASSLIRGYELQFVPPLLRTEEYARAVLSFDDGGVALERRLELLMRCQELVLGPEPARLWVVVDEAALRRRLGDRDVMRRQLTRLMELAELPHITVQVMPFTTGAAAGGAITLLRFGEPELGDVVFLDQLTSSLCLDKPADIYHYRQVMDRLSARAEPPGATVTVLHEVLKST